MATHTAAHRLPWVRRLINRAIMSMIGIRVVRHLVWRHDRRQNAGLAPPHPQLHLGALDDHLLSDLGLHRSEIRAAEYGLLPSDQALNQGEAEPVDNEDRPHQCHFRSGT